MARWRELLTELESSTESVCFPYESDTRLDYTRDRRQWFSIQAGDLSRTKEGELQMEPEPSQPENEVFQRVYTLPPAIALEKDATEALSSSEMGENGRYACTGWETGSCC